MIAVLALSLFASQPARLAADLGSAHYPTRHAATEALERLGSLALPALRAAMTAAPNAEAADRATKLFDAIRRRVSDDAALAGRTISLTMKDAPLGDVLLELRKQTGYEFVATFADRTQRFTLNTGGPVPLWVAVAKLGEAAGLDVESVSPATRVSPVKPMLTPEQTVLKNLREEKLQKLRGELAGKQKDCEELKRSAENSQGAERKELLARHASASVTKQLIEREIAAITELQSGLHDLPAPNGSIKFKPRGTTVAPWCSHAGVRVQAVPVLRLADHPRDRVPVQLRVLPEPGLAWVEAGEAVATKATAPDGAILRHNHILTARPSAMTGTDVVIVQPPDFRGKPTTPIPQFLTTFELVAPEKGSVERLATLQGVVRVRLWTNPGELVAVGSLEKDGPPGAAEDNGVMLTAKLKTNPDDRAAIYLEIGIHYEPSRIRPISSTDAGSDPLWLGQGPQGQLVPQRLQQPPPRGAAPRRYPENIVVTDAEGRQYDLSRQSSRTWSQDNHSYSGQFTYRLTKRDSATGPVAKVAFHGAAVRDVAVPFLLKDVPVAAGSGATPRVGVIDSVIAP